MIVVVKINNIKILERKYPFTDDVKHLRETMVGYLKDEEIDYTSIEVLSA